jgi:Protein of unknown function (DUF1592)/Protein of unknown function (DUF1588)/Protein of unknown function (DUF1595)/Protein of unknown function (DUF1585)/Protein of unknown function (DUF1587)
MSLRGMALGAMVALTACTGTINGGQSGGNAPGGAAGATGAAGMNGTGGSSLPPDTMIAPPGMMAMPVDPTSPDAAKTCVPSIAPAPVRRLSYAEYQATTKDLLGALKMSDTLLLRDPAAHGFENQAALLNPSPTLVEQYGDAAIDAGLKVSGAMPTMLPCAPKTAADEKACGALWLAQFGGKAFRRPLTATELADYTAFFEGERANADFKGAVQLTTEVILQSPQFLYRVEVGDAATVAADRPDRIGLSQYEIASRLSYLLLGSMPDQALFTAAAAGGLGDAAVRETQARRLLKDPRAGAMMVEFHRQWLDLDRLEREPKDATSYPKYDVALKSAIREETDRFVQKVMWQGPGTVAAFLTSTDTQVNGPLAALYGVAAPAGATTWGDVSLNPAERAGFLTRANFLASRAHQLEGSPPLRSVFIRERLLCLPPLMPPADANLSEPKATAGMAAQTNRQLFEARIAPATCKGCHTIINPIGYGLENYDAVGAYRTVDNGLAVDATGTIGGTGDVDGPFTGGVELSQRLAKSKTVATCVAQNWFEYALGRDVTTTDTCRLAKLNVALAEAGGDIRELLVALVKSPEFVFRPLAPVTP